MKSRANLIDRMIHYFNPSAGAKRTQMRVAEAHFQKALVRSYDGASRGRRTSGWRTNSSSVNTENRAALSVLRDRARDLVRNEPLALRGLRIIYTNTIGAGICPTPATGNDVRDQKLKVLWKRWANSTDCDYEGRNTFAGLQALVMRSVVESGECLIRRQRLTRAAKGSIPMKLQVLEPDFLDTLKEEISRDKAGNVTGYTLQGVEFNAEGKRVAYWLFTEHPGGGALGRTGGITSERVPASEVLHIFEPWRPGQVRGVTWFAPVIIKFRDFSDFNDATLLRQKIASLFAAFVEDADGSGPDVVDETDTDSPFGDKLEPGAITEVKPGKRVSFSNPPSPIGYREFSSGQERHLAMGLGVTYEQLVGDYSNVNFSSARMGRIEFFNNVTSWQWHMMVPQLCAPAWDWFVEAAALVGAGTEPAGAEWTAPRRELVDPTKEVPAIISEIRAGLKTIPEAIRENGYDPETVFEEIKKTNDEIDRLGLVLDTDARKVMKAGILQPEKSALSSEEKDGA